MKPRKIVALALIGVLAMLTSGSTGLEPSQSPPFPASDELEIGVEHDGAQIDLRAGQVLVIRLPANLSTGYAWQVEADPTAIRQVGTAEFKPSADRIGAAGDQIMHFQALRPGQTTLRLAYRRPWEDLPPKQAFTVEVWGVGTFDTLRHATPAPVVQPIPTSQPGAAPAASLQTSYFNWCDQGACTSVRDQGGCGSCWAFAAAGVLESNLLIRDGATRDLSEQYLVSCNTDGFGCNGGWAFAAQDYHAWKVPPGEPGPGPVYEGDFPYRAADVPCNPPHTHHERIASWAFVGGDWPSTAAIKQAIVDHGPVAVSICAGLFFQSYTGGVFSWDESLACTIWDASSNHAVVLVGWDDGRQAWRLRNSWGAGWGEGGYMWIRYGTSNVGYRAHYVVYEGVPAAPSGLVAQPISQTQINLSWTDHSNNESGFQIERSPDGTSGWTAVHTTGANVTTYASTGLGSSTTVYYRVRAYTSAGSSAYTNVASATTFSSLSGRVTNAAGVPMGGVQVSAGGNHATTDGAGSYTLANLPPGTYTVQPTAGGYFWSPLRHTVTVPPSAGSVNFSAANIEKRVTNLNASQAVRFGDVLTYTVRLITSTARTVSFYDPVPTHTSYVAGSLTGPAGIAYRPASNTISGSLNLPANTPVTVSFAVRVEVTGTVATPWLIANQAFSHPPGTAPASGTASNRVLSFTYAWLQYLPVVRKGQ